MIRFTSRGKVSWGSGQVLYTFCVPRRRLQNTRRVRRCFGRVVRRSPKMSCCRLPSTEDMGVHDGYLLYMHGRVFEHAPCPHTAHSHVFLFFQNPTTSRDMETAGHIRADEVMRLLPYCHFGFFCHFKFWNEFIFEDFKMHCTEWKAQGQASEGHIPRQTGIHSGDLYAVTDGRALTATAFA